MLCHFICGFLNYLRDKRMDFDDIKKNIELILIMLIIGVNIT